MRPSSEGLTPGVLCRPTWHRSHGGRFHPGSEIPEPAEYGFPEMAQYREFHRSRQGRSRRSAPGIPEKVTEIVALLE